MPRHEKKYLLLCLISLALASCGTQIQLTCVAPSRVGLQKGSSLELLSADTGISGEVRNTLKQELQQGGFYKFTPSADYQLSITDTAESTWVTPGVNIIGDFDTDEETELTTQISLRKRNDAVYGYSRDYKVTTDGLHGDIEELCHEIASDLQPHRIIYTEKVYAPSGNPHVEQAIRYSLGGAWQLAAKSVKLAVQATPGEPEAHYLQGLIERQLEHFDTAETCFRNASRLKPDARYTEAIKTNKLMQMGAGYARMQLNLSATGHSDFNSKTLPAYYRKKNAPWVQIFFHLNLQAVQPGGQKP